MSKILAVADIHINDYKSRNPELRYRLFQGSRTVAQNIVEVGKACGCEYIVLAGDIVEKFMVRPFVQSEVKAFLDYIMANFKEGYIIWGNHDLEGRSTEQEISDACLGVMLPANLHYAHQQIITIDGKKIGFSNWMPKFDLSWIPGKVDVLFTHATINYSPDASDFLESQELDESKFDLAICGDIHRMAALGKYVSIGVPQRCKLSDSEDASGVVYDCPSGTYNWVNLNPHDNLMKFKITNDVTEQDKWDASTKTWYIYKPDDTILSEDGINLKITSWDQIESLVIDAIVKTGLEGVHGEVLKNIGNIDEQEVDFNFTLKKLHCKNWRSIEDKEIDFRRGDKIFLQGSNGSGKSSLLSALKYALVSASGRGTGISSLNPFIQFGKKSCSTEVELDYQGNSYRILRGTAPGDYGLWINGEKQKYASKKDFEADVKERFKFIDYMSDVLFFDADHHRFVNGMTPERRNEVVAKCLKLDRIDALNITSSNMLDQLKTEIQSWESKMSEVDKVLSYIEGRLANLVLPKYTKTELEAMKREGLEIQRKNNEWNQYILKSSRLNAQIQSSQDRLQELQLRQASFRDPSVIDYEINSINQEIGNMNTRLVELGNINVQLNYKMEEHTRLRNEGNQAWMESQNIGLGKTCPQCGQKIKNTEALEKHKAELDRKVEEIRVKIGQVENELNALKAQKDNSAAEYNEISSAVSQLNSEVSKRMAEKSEISRTLQEITRLQGELGRLNSELASLGYVEQVELPENFMAHMSEIENGINAWNSYERDNKDRDDRLTEKNNIQAEVNRLGSYVSDLERYVKLTGPKGAIYEEIMKRLCATWSDANIKYEVDRTGKVGSKNEHLSIIPSYNKGGNFVVYDACSSGEKTILDIDFLSKLVPNAGLLVLDETLKNLDSFRLEEICDALKGMNVGCLILTSHADSLGVFYNRTISLSIDEATGLTKFN